MSNESNKNSNKSTSTEDLHSHQEVSVNDCDENDVGDMENSENFSSQPNKSPEDERDCSSTASNNTPEQALKKSKEELLYLRAEFENFKKRTQKEKQQSIQFANEKFVHELLPILENFELALKHGETLHFEEKSEAANFLTGVKLTHQSLMQALTQLGVHFIGQVGEKFDPLKHEALSLEFKEGAEPDTITQVFQKGCFLHDRLLKSAKVVVSKTENEK